MTDADLSALWSAWFRDRTKLHRACNLISAIVREMADCRAASPPPAAEEPAARVSKPAEGRGDFLGSLALRECRGRGCRCPKCGLDDVVCSHPECPPLDPTGTDPAPYPPQIKPRAAQRGGNVVSAIVDRLTAAFEAWFRDSGVDFWSETDAPAELAKIAAAELEAALDRLAGKQRLEGGTLPSGAPMSDATKQLIREAVRTTYVRPLDPPAARPEAAFGPPFTVYLDTGPWPTPDPIRDPKDDA